MSLTQQYLLQRLVSECYSFFGRQEKEAETALFQRLDQINTTLCRNIRETFIDFSAELIIKFAEVAVEVPSRRQYAHDIIKLYFQRYKDPTQFYIRGLLVKAQLVAYQAHDQHKKGQQLVGALKQSIGHIAKALDIIAGPAQVGQVKGKDSKGDPNAGGSNKQRYAFLIYNASNCLYKIIRFMMRQNWQRNFCDIVERIYKLFEEVDEPDHNWRCRFTWVLYLCLYDADKKPDAFKILDMLWEKTKNKPCEFQEALFRARVHVSKQNNALAAVIKKDLEGPSDEKGWRVLEVLQKIKSGIFPEPQVEKELMGVINQISSAVLTGNDSSANNVSPVMQERLAEAGRIALQFNLINIANSVTNFLGKVRQPTQKAMVLNEYNKAELLIKKPGPIADNKTGMKLNNVQMKLQQIERRSQSLKILEKVMIINKRLNDADLIYEGSILIWNTCLPFMTPAYRELLTKAFEAASSLLEQVDSTDHGLRVKLHLELAKAYFNNEAQFFRVEEHLNKSLSLDYSTPLAKLTIKPDPEQDPGLYQRPYDRYLESLKEKALLKKNTHERTATQLDKIMMDLWNVMGQKSENTRIDILQKCLGNVVNIQQKDYDIEEARQRSLVDDEIRQEMLAHKQATLCELKKKKLLAAQIAELAFQWQINQVAEKACEFVIVDKWDPKNAIEMIISQAKCYYFLAQIHIDQMIRDNLQVAFSEPTRIEDDDDENKPEELSPAEKESILARKKKIFNQFGKGMELAEQTLQSWLIFNGAIYIWNNFLHIFKNPKSDPLLLPDISQILKVFFEAMKNSLKQGEKKQIASYDIDAKTQVLANIGLVYARQMENLKQPDEVNKICEVLLTTQLSPHTRKLINSIKSRVSSSKGAPVGQKPADKNAKAPAGQPPANAAGTGDLFLFEIFSQLQIIKSSVGKGQNEGLIKKCFETLENWKAKDNDETELQLHAELWARLASLALNQQNITMYKYALRCVEYSLSLLIAKADLQNIPTNRLRWYSLAEYLYSDALLKIVNPQTQQPENCERLLFAALDHAVQAANKGLRCNINVLVTDAGKQVWNISARLQQSATNRQKLIKPLYNTLNFFKTIKQKSQNDLLMLLSQLLFKAALENGEYKIGESAADMLFELLPKNLHRPLWQAKMIFMSKQGKNELQAISNMKQADASLQAKLWVKLARVSNQQAKQNAAYNKAIEILKKENSVEIVEVLIEFAEFKLRTGKERVLTVIGNLLLAADYLIDIEYGDDNEQDIEDDRVTVFSRSTRGKRSQYSNSQKSKQSKTKKPVDKKTVVSGSKSKGSRMNRTARVTKTVKSKNTKSIFTQREEQVNPESLNCAHYQRLFRIHTILAQIAQTSEQRIRYALDAKEFLIKILEVSFRTLNTMDENAAKYTNVLDDKKESKPQEYMKKYNMPVACEDWIRLQLPKQFLEKVKTYEDYNFMGVFLFDKAELTFTYITHLIDLMDRMAFQLQTIPLHFFARFLAKEILNNPTLLMLSELKLCETLRRCNFAKEVYQSILNPVNLSKFKLTEQDRKLALNKTQSLKAKPLSTSTEITTISTIPPPNLVRPFGERTYDLWVGIAEQYIKIGELPKASDLLKEALKHCKILSDIETMGRCYLILTKIAYLQGELSEAANDCMTVNKLCRDVRQWLEVYPVMFKILAKIEKYDDLMHMTLTTDDTLQRMIKQSEKDRKLDGPSHEQQLLDMKHLLTCVQIHRVKLAYLQLTEDLSMDRLQRLSDTLTILEENSELSGQTNMLPCNNYVTFTKLANQLFERIQQNNFEHLLNNNCDKLLTSVVGRLLKILNRMEEQIMNGLKYTSVGLEQHIFFTNNPLITIHYNIRLSMARAYVLVGVFRRVMRFQSFNQQDQNLDEVHSLPDFEPLKKYLEQLNLQIQKALTLVPKRLESTETAISILSNLEVRIPQDSYLYIILGVEMCSARRRLAQSKEQLSQVWTGAETQADQTYAISSLQQCVSFLEKYEERVDNVLAHSASLSYAKRLYVELLENTGVLVPEKSFEALVKYQHYRYNQRVFKRVLSVVQPNNKMIINQRLLRQFSQPIPEAEAQLTSNLIFQGLTKFPSYSEAIKLLPPNHVLAVLQIGLDSNEIYFGCYTSIKGATPETKIFLRKHELDNKEKSFYSKLKKEFSQIKTSLARVPIDEADLKKYTDIVQQSNRKLEKLMANLEQLSKWWTQPLAELLNAKKAETVAAVDPKDVKKTGKDAGKASKKGGKDEVSTYQSILGASPSGIESVTLLLDGEFAVLPLESLQVFNNVPSMGRDSSLFYVSRKLREMGYKPQLNNSNGFGADRSKFVCYDYKTDDYNGEGILNAVMKETPAFKFDGVSSKKRIPSVGEYQRLMGSGGILHVYGSCCLVNILRCGTLLNSMEVNKVRLMVVFDSINARKSTLEKYDAVDKGETLSLEQEESALIDILNLMNVSLVKNRWSPPIDTTMEIIKRLYKIMGEEIYIGGAVKKVLQGAQTPLEKLLLVYNGPAVIRI